MEEQSYNGWTNKPTWLVKLWLDNEEYAAEEAYKAYDSGGGGYLQEFVETVMLNMPENGLGADLMGYVLACVNWEEIGEALTEDYGPEDDEDEEDEDEEEEDDADWGDGDTQEEQDNWERRSKQAEYGEYVPPEPVGTEQQENADFAHDDDFYNREVE